MSLALKIALTVVGLVAPVGFVFYQAALSPDNWIFQGETRAIGRMGAIMARQAQSLGPDFHWWRSATASIGW